MQTRASAIIPQNLYLKVLFTCLNCLWLHMQSWLRIRHNVARFYIHKRMAWEVTYNLTSTTISTVSAHPLLDISIIYRHRHRHHQLNHSMLWLPAEHIPPPPTCFRSLTTIMADLSEKQASVPVTVRLLGTLLITSGLFCSLAEICISEVLFWYVHPSMVCGSVAQCCEKLVALNLVATFILWI